MDNVKSYTFNSLPYQKIDFITKKTKDGIGSIKLKENNGEVDAIFLKYNDYEYKSLHLKKYTKYMITLENVHCILTYLCGNDDVLEEGICFIEFDEDGLITYTQGNMPQAYNQEHRNQVHFAPFKAYLVNGTINYTGDNKYEDCCSFRFL